MNLLQGLLPGLRSVRAPLAAGYIWLVTAWLLAYPYAAQFDPKHTSTLRIAIERLTPIVSMAGWLGAGSFAAYLFGIASEAFTSSVSRIALARFSTWRSLWTRLPARLPQDFIVDLGWFNRSVSTSPRHWRRYPKWQTPYNRVRDQRLALLAPVRVLQNASSLYAAEAAATLISWVRGQLEDIYLRDAGSNDSEFETSLEQALSVAPKRRVRVFEEIILASQSSDALMFDTIAFEGYPASMFNHGGRFCSFKRETPGMGEYSKTIEHSAIVEGLPIELGTLSYRGRGALDTSEKWGLAHVAHDSPVLISDMARILATIGAVIAEFDRITPRLIGQSPELYSAIDRNRAEAEFRWAVSLPLAALSLAVWVAAGHHAASPWVAVVVLGFSLAVGLVLLGARSDRVANTLLIDAVLTQGTTSPVIERLRQLLLEKMKHKHRTNLT